MRPALLLSRQPCRHFSTASLLHAPKKKASKSTVAVVAEQEPAPPAALPQSEVLEVASLVGKHKEAIAALVRRTSRIQEEVSEMQQKASRNSFRLKSARTILEQVDGDRRFVRLLARQFLLEVQFVGHRYSMIWERLRVLERELLARTDPTLPLPTDANSTFPSIPNFGRDTTVSGDLTAALRDHHVPGETPPVPIPAFEADAPSSTNIRRVMNDLKAALSKATSDGGAASPVSADAIEAGKFCSLRELLRKSIQGDRIRLRRARRRLARLSKGEASDTPNKSTREAFHSEREKELAKREDLVIMLEGVMGLLGSTGEGEDSEKARSAVEANLGSVQRLMQVTLGGGEQVKAATTPTADMAAIAELSQRLAKQEELTAKLLGRVSSLEARQILVVHQVESCRATSEQITGSVAAPSHPMVQRAPSTEVGSSPLEETHQLPTAKDAASVADFLPSAIESIPQNYLVLHHVPDSITIGSLTSSLGLMLHQRKTQFITQYRNRTAEAGRDAAVDERRIADLVSPPLSIAACSLYTPRSVLPQDEGAAPRSEERTVGGKAAFLLYFASQDNAKRVMKILDGQPCNAGRDEEGRSFTLNFRLLNKNDYHLW